MTIPIERAARSERRSYNSERYLFFTRRRYIFFRYGAHDGSVHRAALAKALSSGAIHRAILFLCNLLNNARFDLAIVMGSIAALSPVCRCKNRCELK